MANKEEIDLTATVEVAEIGAEQVGRRIYTVRGQSVMLSTHLAELYGVELKALVQAVKRNLERFPDDFMFQFSAEEFSNLKSQSVTSRWGGLRCAAPYAFAPSSACAGR